MISNKVILEPKISILMPAYNHAVYILESLNSVLEETYQNKELIIIDDGSQDQTVEIISTWIKNNKDKINTIFVSRENRGITTTLNELIGLANGEYLRLFSSDDLLIKGGLKCQMGFLLSQPQKNAVLSECQVIDESGALMFSSSLCEFGCAKKVNYKKDLKYAIISDWNVYGPGILIKKSFLNEIGRYNEDFFIDDWDLYLRIVSNDSLMFLDEMVGKYRVHRSSTCRNQPTQRHIKNLEEKCRIINFRKKGFNYLYRLLLFSEFTLTKSKINYFERRFFQASSYYFLSKLFLILFLIFHKLQGIKNAL